MEFKVISASDVNKDENLTSQMNLIIDKYDYLNGYEIVESMDGSSLFGDWNKTYCITSSREGELLGFAIVDVFDDDHDAWLNWIVVDKDKTKGFENKLLLDKVIDFCKSKGVSNLSWKCLSSSWGNVHSRREIFEKFGYNVKNKPSWGDFELDLRD